MDLRLDTGAFVRLRQFGTRSEFVTSGGQTLLTETKEVLLRRTVQGLSRFGGCSVTLLAGGSVLLGRGPGETLRGLWAAAEPTEAVALHAAHACFAILRTVHAAGYCLRAICPDTFVLAGGTWYLRDTSFCTRVGGAGREHAKPCRQLRASPGFASLNAISGLESGMRDDLESLALVFVFLSNGMSLPWPTSPETDTADAILVQDARAENAWLLQLLRKDPGDLALRHTHLQHDCVRVMVLARALGFAQTPPLHPLCATYTDEIPTGPRTTAALALVLTAVWGAVAAMSWYS